MSQPVRILILGGGYVAITLTRGLRRAMARGEVEVTVVSRDNFHVFHGFVSEMMTGRIGPGQILSPIRRIFAPAKIHVGEIEAIDLAEKVVHVTRHLDGSPQQLHYDHLVFALGSVDHLAMYPGLAEHAFRLKTYSDCFHLRNHILSMLELAEIEEDPVERRRLLTFFVAGGGYAGTEVAGELANWLDLMTRREYRAIKREECRIVLVHPGETILPELHGGTGAAGYGKGHPRLVEYATRHMRRLGVELMTQTRVTHVTPAEVGLSTGERVPTRTIISAVGTRPAPILDGLAIAKDPRGKVQAARTLQVEGQSHLWAAGDCANVPHPHGGSCPPVGIYALKEGEHIARNLLRVVRGQEPLPFTYPGLGQAVSIGRRTAVGEMRGIEFKGLICWLIWRMMLLYYIPTWDRKLRLLADWLIWPLVGRDIVEMSVRDRDDYELSHQLYQPGEEILADGRRDRYVYLILEGTVSLSGPNRAERLSVGHHFGMTGADFQVRAETQVKVLAVREDQVAQLKQVLQALATVR